jgi:hypothetical protein
MADITITEAVIDVPLYAAEFWNAGEGESPVIDFDALGAPDYTESGVDISNINWGLGSPSSSIMTENFVARYTGTSTFAGGFVQFSITADDGVRVYLDGDLIMERWDNDFGTSLTEVVDVSAGVHTIVVEYYEDLELAYLQFSYEDFPLGGAGTAETPWEITECYDIEYPGYYELQNNITDVSGDCIEIEANDVFFNGGGYTISSDAEIEQENQAIEAQGYDRIHISNIIIDGFFDGIMIWDSVGTSTISYVTITSTTDDGIDLQGVSQFTISTSTIDIAGDDGIQVRAYDDEVDTFIGSSDISINAVSISNIESNGIEAEAIQSLTITYVDISTVLDGDGISIEDAYNGYTDEDIISDDIFISYNNIDDIASDGIYVVGATNATVSENNISSIGTDGIDFSTEDEETNTDITITDNILTDINDNGIELDEVYGATITGNSLQIAGDGIAVDDSEDIEFTDNTITPTMASYFEIPQVETETIVVDIIDAEDSLSADDASFTYTLPFAFNFFGRNIVNIEISTNGSIELLEDGESCTLCSDRGTYTGNLFADIIFASYDDLYVSTTEHDYVAVFNQEDEYVVVEWSGSTYSDDDSTVNPIHFQVVMYPNGEVQWNFMEMNFEIYDNDMFTGVYDFEQGKLYGAGFAIDEVSSYSGDFSGAGEFELVTELSENIGLDIDNVADSSFVSNSIRAAQWVYATSTENIVFNDSDSGNTYYFLNGDGAWTAFEIYDTDDNGFADAGSDRPFSESTLGLAYWEGEGMDEYPASDNTDVPKTRSSGGASYIPPTPPRVRLNSSQKVDDPDTDGASLSGAFVINGGALSTDRRTVRLDFTDVELATQVAVSNSSDFTGISYVPFSSTLSHELTIGFGIKTVYVKIRSADGGILLLKDTIQLTEQSTTVTPINPNQVLQCTSNVYLTSAVKFGANNNAADVRLLEEFLNTYENAKLTVNGIYEQVDYNAVVRWQEKYAADILTPWGLAKGTGYVYTNSLKKIKAIHEANCATAASTTPPVVPTTATVVCLNTTDTLRLGMNNAFVATAQRLFKKLGYFPVDIDTTGYFGPVTETATRAFQAANGIDQVGFIGPQTRARLNELGCK